MDCNSDGAQIGILDNNLKSNKAILIEGDKAGHSDDEHSPGKNLLDDDHDMPDAYKGSKMIATAKKPPCESSLQVHTKIGD